MSDETSTGLREEVPARYAAAARAVLEPDPGSLLSLLSFLPRARAAAARPRTQAVAGYCANAHCSQRYDTKLWMRDLMEGAAYLPK
jgi:hypothetical protein